MNNFPIPHLAVPLRANPSGVQVCRDLPQNFSGQRPTEDFFHNGSLCFIHSVVAIHQIVAVWSGCRAIGSVFKTLLQAPPAVCRDAVALIFRQRRNLESYYERARRYVDENYDEPALNKPRNNIPLDEEDWKTLERIFWSEVGTAEEYKREIHTADDEDIPLGKFVRSLTGLDKSTAEQAFNEFLDTGLYTQEQITFVRYIIDWLVQYGTLARQEMAYDEFSGGMDVTEVFEDNIILFQRIMTVIDNINANAMPLAA